MLKLLLTKLMISSWLPDAPSSFIAAVKSTSYVLGWGDGQGAFHINFLYKLSFVVTVLQLYH